MGLSTRQVELKKKLITDGNRAAGLDPGNPRRKPFDDLVQSTHTRDLLVVLNHCLHHEKISAKLRGLFIYVLVILPLRPGGVRDCFEFVVAVHPSTGGPQSSSSDDSQVERRGPGITPEARQAASRLLSSPPSFLTPLEWFTGIAPQLLSLLDGVDNEKELASVAAYIIGKVLGPERYGKVGREGWTAFALPILDNITAQQSQATSSGASKVSIDSASLAQALKRLETLANSHPTPALTMRLLRPIRLPLWLIASWSPSSKQLEEAYLNPAKRMFQTYLKLENPLYAFHALEMIVKNLTSSGQGWKYSLNETGGLQAIESPNLPSLLNSQPTEMNLTVVDHSISFLVDVLSETADVRGIPELFLALLRKTMSSEDTSIRIKSSINTEGFEIKFKEAKLVQEMLGKFPEKLVTDPKQILEFVHEFLDVFIKSLQKTMADQEAIDQVTILLSLLHGVLSSQGFKTLSFQIANASIISKIVPLLEKLVATRSSEISDSESGCDILTAARSLLHFLWAAQDQQENPESTSSSSRDKYAEDIKTRDLAMSYLTSLESPPPVTVQGLHLLTSLIKTSSPVLSIPSTIHLLLTKLQAAEEYIYLAAITTLTELSFKHPRTVVSTLLEKYVDVDEMQDLDTRLRIGETLTKIIECQSKGAGYGLGVQAIEELSTALVHTASLRPTKPKTAKALEKAKRLQERQEKKNQEEAAAAWGGDVPDMSDLHIESEEEQEKAAILQRVLDSWTTSGTRNVEDTRIRSSALSIFSTLLATHLTLFRSKVIEVAVDLSLMILKLETEDGAAVLRRSAILLILDLLRSLDEVREKQEKVPFEFEGNSVEIIGQVLGYIEATDGDGLVRQHARDAKESLGNWNGREILHGLSSGGVEMVTEGLDELRGLSVNPGYVGGGEARRKKPVIEEIE